MDGVMREVMFVELMRVWMGSDNGGKVLLFIDFVLDFIVAFSEAGCNVEKPHVSPTS